MAKHVMHLTDALIKQAAPKEKPYKLSDGAGLYIEVQPSGSKIWRMKYHLQGWGESALTFGPYPEVSIAKAREHLLTAQQMLELKQDPRAELNREKPHPPPMPIPLEEIFDEPEWGHVHTSILHVTRHAIRQLETTLFPTMARIPIDEARRNIQQAAVLQIERAGLQAISLQLEYVATALAASYLRSGMSMEELVSTMRDSRRRTRRASDVADFEMIC